MSHLLDYTIYLKAQYVTLNGVKQYMLIIS